MKASSDAARTSFAAPPIAAPNAAKPAPPATIAGIQSANRPQSRSTKRPRPASIRSVTTTATTTPSRTFSPSSADFETSPRVSLAKAFSSRSSASEPATSSTVTNISVIVAATAIANVSRLGVSPETTSLSTLIGWETELSRSPATPRFSAARWLKRITESSSSRSGLSAASWPRIAAEDLLGALAARGP